MNLFPVLQIQKHVNIMMVSYCGIFGWVSFGNRKTVMIVKRTLYDRSLLEKITKPPVPKFLFTENELSKQHVHIKKLYTRRRNCRKMRLIGVPYLILWSRENLVVCYEAKSNYNCFETVCIL